jgi:hypothetical protein
MDVLKDDLSTVFNKSPELKPSTQAMHLARPLLLSDQAMLDVHCYSAPSRHCRRRRRQAWPSCSPWFDITAVPSKTVRARAEKPARPAAVEAKRAAAKACPERSHWRSHTRRSGCALAFEREDVVRGDFSYFSLLMLKLNLELLKQQFMEKYGKFTLWAGRAPRRSGR